MTDQLLKEIYYSTARSSGPGGQHVNKTESKVTLHWIPDRSEALTEAQKSLVKKRLRSKLSTIGELQLSSQRYRSQVKNREDVTERFLTMIKKLSRPEKKRKKTKPTRSSVEKRLKEKKAKGEKKKMRREGF